MRWEGLNQDGVVMRGLDLTTWERHPPLVRPKIHKNQFWGTSAHNFKQGSVTWFLGSGDAGGDMDEDVNVNGDGYVVPAMPRILTDM